MPQASPMNWIILSTSMSAMTMMVYASQNKNNENKSNSKKLIMSNNKSWKW